MAWFVCVALATFSFGALSMYDVRFDVRGPMPTVVPTERVMRMTDSSGAHFRCFLPPPQEEGAGVVREEGVRALTLDEIATIDDALGRNFCIKTIAGWWTYSFCWGSALLQEHYEGQVVVSQFALGLGHWKTEATSQMMLDVSHDRRTLRVTMEGGALCDLTEKPRGAVISVSCAPPGVESRMVVSERELCQYDVTVVSSDFCVGPLREEPQGVVSIPCFPEMENDTRNGGDGGEGNACEATLSSCDAMVTPPQ